MRAEDFEADGIKISPEKSARLVASGRAQQGQECFLSELFGVGRIRNAATEEAINGLFVTVEELREGVREALRESKHQPFVAQAVPLRFGLGGTVGWVGGRLAHRFSRKSL